jgi:hypothetical protein
MALAEPMNQVRSGDWNRFLCCLDDGQRVRSFGIFWIILGEGSSPRQKAQGAR